MSARTRDREEKEMEKGDRTYSFNVRLQVAQDPQPIERPLSMIRVVDGIVESVWILSPGVEDGLGLDVFEVVVEGSWFREEVADPVDGLLLEKEERRGGDDRKVREASDERRKRDTRRS